MALQTLSIRNENSDFFDRVYQVVVLIPPGRATTYGAIANYLGAKRSSRMVGWAMNAAHAKPEIPAHRVVNRNGLLTGKAHFSPPEKMEELLKLEGVLVINDAIQNWKTVFWDPMLELGI